MRFLIIINKHWRGFMKIFSSAIILLLIFNLSFAQRAKINTEAVTPHGLTALGLTTNSVSSGLNIVPNETFVYFSAKNIGNADPIITATFTLQSKPTGSVAALTALNPMFSYFKADVKGAYIVKLTITTATGTHDTTATFYSASYVGTGKFDDVPAGFPNCMSCHGVTPKFTAIFDEWKVSGHATMFKEGITGLKGSYYGSNCFKCHTVGYNHDIAASNDGFDDRAVAAGWVFYSPPGPTKWDSLKAKSSALTQFATIGCENCHGPGSEHGMGGDKAKIQISLNSGTCGQCHDKPWRYNRYAQWENSLHSLAVWSSSFAQGAPSQNNNLNNCIRCHDGQGFVNFTKGKTTNTTGWTEARHTKLGCPTCHDPHSGHLRKAPTVADTLANGFKYTVGGKGMSCMNCHKARRNAKSFAVTSVSSAFWGPHYGVESDVLLGQNAAEFGIPFISGNHKNAVIDGCVQCHMVATVDTGNVNRDKVGQHSFRLLNEATGYEHVESCKDCHGANIKSFKDFIAAADFDGNGLIEDIQSEVKGLLKKLKQALPPVGIDSVDWRLVRDYKGADSLNMRRAYYNYKIMVDDNSFGMHNAKFSIDVLRKSVAILTGVEFEDNNIPTNFDISQNYPNPFNPSTEIRFSVAKTENVNVAIYDAVGRLIKVMVNEVLNPGNYKLTWNGENSNGSKVVSGIYFYRFESSSFEATKKMVLLK